MFRLSCGARRAGFLRAIFCAIALHATAASAADPQLAAFSDSPDPVAAGGNVVYSIRVDNTATDAATNTTLTVSIPAGATFVSATPPSENCSLVATNVVCNLGTLGPNGADVRNIAITLRALGPGPSALNLTATVAADNDTNPANNTQVQQTTVVEGADLSLVKTDAPDPVIGGANVTYTLTVSNAGPNVSAGLRIIDNLSPSSTFVSAGGSGWSCGNAGSVVTCTRAGPHAVGAPIPPVTIIASVTAAGGTITNSATVEPFAVGGVPLVADPTASNNGASADTAVSPGADINIAQKLVTSSTPATAGQPVTFQIQPRNGGPAAAVNAVVTDVLPAGWTFVSAGGPNWTCSNAGLTVTCSRASLPAGATDNITIVATAPSNAVVGQTGTTYTNTATIASSTNDPSGGNNSGAVNILVLPDGADLRITKSKTPNPVAQGSTLTSTITVINGGPRVATGPLRMVDLLPAGETFVSATGAGWTCSNTAQTITCDHPNGAGLAVGAALPAITVTSTATASGTLTNTACTGGSVPAGSGATPLPPVEGDPNATNDCTSVGSSSTAIHPDLGITKTTTTPAGGDKTVGVGEDRVVYTLVITNLSAIDAATAIRIDDTVPAFINGRTPAPLIAAVVSGGSTATFTCGSVNAAVTCTQSGGVLNPGGTVTVTIQVLRPLSDGTFTNTATVTNTVEGDPSAANNSASDTVTIDPIADVELADKTATPASIRAGEQTTYVMSYRNNGPSPAANVVVTDTFTFAPGDAGLSVISITSSKAGSSCSIAAGAQLTPASPQFTCTNTAAMADNEAQTVTLVVRPNFQAGNPARVVGNTASLTTTTVESISGGNNGNNSRSATLNVNPAQVDLLINKTEQFDPIGYTAGATFIDYTLRATNNGPSYGTGVRIFETLTAPAGKRIRFVCDTATLGGVCNAVSLCTATNITSAPGGTLNFSCLVPAGSAITGAAIGDVAAGQSKSVFVRFEALDTPAPSGDLVSNSVTVTANEPDSFPGNNTTVEPTTLRQFIDLQATKTSSLGTVTLNQPFNWIVTVSNTGPADSLQTIVTDTLPAGAAVTGAVTYTKTVPAGSGACAVAGNAITCTMGQLNNGATATITIPARITAYPAGGTITNQATVGTNPSDTGALDNNPGNNTGANTVTVTRSSITGTVFRDRDANGQPGGASETGIGGVSLTLTGTDLYGNSISQTVSTDASGVYTFTDLPPSNGAGYTITETQPAAFVNGVNPTGGAFDSLGGTRPPSGAPGFGTVIASIVVGGNVAGTGYNFAEVARPSISGTVYRDLNNNGVADGGAETGIAGATVQLFREGDVAPLTSTTTNASGAYTFGNLDPGIYYVQELQPAGFLDGRDSAGLIGGAACAACTTESTYVATNEPATTDRIRNINVGNGDDATAMNFGELPPASLAGSVFVDFNVNGSRDVIEVGISNVTLTLTGTDDRGAAVSRAVTTDGSGNYAIGTLRPSNAAGYTITETQPAGFGNGPNPPAGADSLGGTRPASGAPGFGTVVSAIPVAVGQAGVNYTFSEVGGTTVSGVVYIDRNRDGALQVTDVGRIAGVTLQLVDPASGAVLATTITDSNGNYVFTNAPVGNYQIVETQPAGYGSSTPNTLPVLIPAAGVAGQNFGETAGSLAGSVFTDTNNNGTQQAGELGIGGQAIELIDAATGTTIATINTDASGNYRFDDLRAGNYTLRQPAQPPATVNGITTAGSSGGAATAVATLPSAIANIALPAAADSSGNNFAELMPASIAGSIYNDGNNNGLRDAGEAGFAAQTLQLTGTNDLGQSINLSVTTNASGNYSFANLRPGTYTVTQPTQPAASINGQTTAGSSGGTATAVTTLPSAISNIVLGVGTAASGYNFGELGDSPNVVVGKQAVGSFATGNDAVYRITVANTGQIATSGVYTVEDRLPAGIVLAARPSGNGWTCTGDRGNPNFACTSSQVIAAAQANPFAIDVPVTISSSATGGAVSATLNNSVIVSGGGELAVYAPSPAELANFATNPAQLPVCATPAAHNACRTATTVVQAANVGGTVWYDIGAVRRQLDQGDQRLANWTVEIVDGDSPAGGVVRRTTTRADGSWSVVDLIPNRAYLVRFIEPGSGVVWGVPVSSEQGSPPAPCVTSNPGNTQRSSCVEAAPVAQLRIVLTPGDNLLQQSLPVNPAGVVYESISRQPVPGSVVALAPSGSCAGYDPAAHIVNAQLGGYTIAGQSISMTVGELGAYQFLFTPSAPARCAFQLTVTPPPTHSFVSSVIAPQPNTLATPPAPGSFDVQPQATPPTIGQSTTYYVTFDAGSGTQSVLNNHLPVDPRSLSGLVISKTGSVQLVELGDSMQYIIRVRNNTPVPVTAAFVEDRLPRGFRYIAGTAMIERGGVRSAIADPIGSPGPTLTFAIGAVPANGDTTLTYRVRVGVGSQQGDGINTAQAKQTATTDCRASPAQCSNEARFRVRISGGVFGNEACIAGKVFVDCNANHLQDEGELGIPGVRLWLQDGTSFTTDSEGKYSYCGLQPKLHVLKVDRPTLPRGSKLVASSNRNALDPNSLFVDLKNGELHRADFVEGSCSAPVLDQVKTRRGAGEVNAPSNTPRVINPVDERLKFRSPPLPGARDAR